MLGVVPMRRMLCGLLVAVVAACAAGACSSERSSPTATSTSSGPAPTELVMPNVVGMFWVDAEPNLRALGWTGVIVMAPAVPNSGRPSHAIVTQDPAAGQRVPTNATITLRFAT